MIKVLHIIVGLDVGGAELMLKRLIESNPISIPETVVVSLTSLGVIGESLRAGGVRVHALKMSSFVHFPVALCRLIRLLHQYRPEIVQTWMYHADLLGGVAARMAGIRNVIWGIRTTEMSAGGSFATVIVRWCCARLSSRVPQVIICAAEASRSYHRAVGYDAKKMIVVPNGYDFSVLKVSASERQFIREECNLNNTDLVVGSLGRFHVDKDQKNFVYAAGLLASHHPQLRFLMVGRGLDWQNEQLVNWIVKTGYKDRFILLGERRDAPRCLAAMDIFCLHSRSEGFPNVLAEAMAMGLPCVTTNVGDAAILLADTGVVVSKEDSEALAQGVEQLLLLSQDARFALGNSAKTRVQTEFSIKRTCERFEKIYRELLSKGSVKCAV